MSEADILQRYDAYLWKQVYAFCRLADRQSSPPMEDFIQEARLAFLQHIRTHDETEWMACTLTIKRALYDYARREYPLTVSHHGFAKVLKEKRHFYPHDEYLTALGQYYEDDHSSIDLREVIDHLGDKDRQVVLMRLEGMTYREIAEIINVSEQAIGLRVRTIRRRMIA